MKQETLSILFYILKNKNKLLKNGEAPVLLRVTIEGRGSDNVRIQRSTNPNLWDQAKGRSKGKDRASLELNDYIKSLDVKLSCIHKELLLEQAFITPSLLLQKLFGAEEQRTVLSTFREHNDECRKLIGIDYEKITINRYDNCMRNIAAAIQREYGNQQEFTERTGLTPTIEEYQTIESIYMAAGEMDKDEFCKEFKKCGNNRLVTELFRTVCTLKGQYDERINEIDDLHEQKNEMVDFLIDRAQAFSDKELLEKASEMVGQKEVIRRRIVKGHTLWAYETEWMLNNLFQ